MTAHSTTGSQVSDARARRSRPWWSPGLLLVIAIACAGCSDEPPPATGSAASDSASAGTAPTSGDLWAGGPDGGQVMRETSNPVEFSSFEGGFSVTWPSGCGKLRTRMPSTAPPPEEFPGTEQTMIEVLCRRYGEKREIAWVAGLFNEKTARGTAPDPTHVVDRVKYVMESYGTALVEQTPLRRGSLEGIEVKAERPGDDPGELWLRGILAGPHFYIICAWKEFGGLFRDPEFEVFFDSFRITAYQQP